MKEASEFPDAHLRVFDRRTVSADDDVRSVYFIGICGTGMGSLADLFRKAGFDVSGSDANAYPPMSDTLREAGITIHEGYDAGHLDNRPDLIVVGNACTPTHPEAARARDESLPQLSFPEAFAEFFIGQRRSLVVAGTHGKTTTSALLAHTATAAGLDPTYLVGGVVLNGESSCRVGSGDITIVEGDEYDTAYFDKRPKFMLYRPTAAVVTSLEFDHADIYDDWDDYRGAFERFVGLVPDSGYLVLNNDAPAVTDLARHATAQVLRYGLLGNENDIPAGRDIWQQPDITAENVVVDESGIRFDLILPDEAPIPTTLPVTGRHNLSNALAVAALAWSQGISPTDIVSAFRSFKGIKRRQEVIGTIDDVIVIDDFAHHPTAASVTIAGVRERWKTRRLVAVFEPRSNSSRRKVFEQPYIDAFAQADVALFARPPFRHNDSVDDFMDVERICEALRVRGIDASASGDQPTLRARLSQSIRPGDVVLIMSNGGFGGLHNWVLGELSSRQSLGKRHGHSHHINHRHDGNG